MALNLDKIEAEAKPLLSLAKTAKEVVESQNLDGRISRVALVLDYSLSMSHLYQSGAVQALAEKVLALATQMDDDGEIDIYTFDSGADYLGTLNLSDYQGGIDRLTQGKRMGSTNYAQAIREVLDKSGLGAKKSFFGKPKPVDAPLDKPAESPVFAIFITDGAPNNAGEAKAALIEASFRPVFWKFISLGQSIPFLVELDDMTGRHVDNADYFPVKDINQVPDATLYSHMLDEYLAWFDAQKAAGQIA